MSRGVCRAPLPGIVPSTARREAEWSSGYCPPPAGKAGGAGHPTRGGRLGPSLICSPGKPAPAHPDWGPELGAGVELS